jgi:hypothetical protein
MQLTPKRTDDPLAPYKVVRRAMPIMIGRRVRRRQVIRYAKL